MKILLLVILFIPLTSFGEIFEVHSVARKESRPGTWIIKLIDGRVGFLDQEECPDVNPENLQRSIIDAQLSEKSVLSGIRILEKLNDAPGISIEKSKQERLYIPTIYSSYDYATDVLAGMKRNWVNTSQCYDRSHVWAYEEAYAGRNLQKAFLFFSDAYISRNDFPWWFHTAPYALVKLKGETVERIMDPAFTSYPLKFKLWTDMFMNNKVECKLVQKYSDYSTHPGEDDCYMMKTSIYFWQPKDLEAHDKSGVQKSKFIDWEIKHAYKNAFGITL